MKEHAILKAFCKKLVTLDYDIFGIRKAKKPMAQDEDRWITVHPGGKGMKSDGSGAKGGTHVLIDGETGEIKGGMGGKFNGKTIREVKAQSKQTQIETGSSPVSTMTPEEQKQKAKDLLHYKQQAFTDYKKRKLTEYDFYDAIDGYEYALSLLDPKIVDEVEASFLDEI